MPGLRIAAADQLLELPGQLELPALRERVGDILPLAEYFVGIYSVRLGRSVPLISEAAQQALEAHAWPGNTRELENVIHFALLVSEGGQILPEHLDLPDTTPLSSLARQLEQLVRSRDPQTRHAVRRLLLKPACRWSRNCSPGRSRPATRRTGCRGRRWGCRRSRRSCRSNADHPLAGTVGGNVFADHLRAPNLATASSFSRKALPTLVMAAKSSTPKW